MNQDLKRILAFLNRKKVRATYGAVGEALGVAARGVGSMLGERRQEASWVVSAATGEPSGYEKVQKHPQLHTKKEILSTGLQLLRAMAGLKGPPAS